MLVRALGRDVLLMVTTPSRLLSLLSVHIRWLGLLGSVVSHEVVLSVGELIHWLSIFKVLLLLHILVLCHINAEFFEARNGL